MSCGLASAGGLVFVILALVGVLAAGQRRDAAVISAAAARELVVYHRLRQSPYWETFSNAEVIDAYKQIMRAKNKRRPIEVNQ